MHYTYSVGLDNIILIINRLIYVILKNKMLLRNDAFEE